MKILMIGGNPHIMEDIVERLQPIGFEFKMVGDASEGTSAARGFPFDAILIDVILANSSGIHVVEALRRHCITAPIIVVSEVSETRTIVKMLDAGADDYLKVPFHVHELVLRLRTIMRRQKQLEAESATVISGGLSGGLVVDFRRKRVSVDGRQVKLPSSEYLLLEYLARNIGIPISREELRQAMKGDRMPRDFSSNTVEVFVARIRQAISEASDGMNYIDTVRGCGYVLLQKPVPYVPRKRKMKGATECRLG
jgi:two-component system response regulator PrrA